MTTSIDDLRFFRVVAASQTLTAAARELECSLPVVSKRLSALERRLDARLVHRGTRRLTLTSEGELFAARLEEILDRVRELEDLVGHRSGDLRGSIVVQATSASAARTSPRCSASSPPGTRGSACSCTRPRCPCVRTAASSTWPSTWAPRRTPRCGCAGWRRTAGCRARHRPM